MNPYPICAIGRIDARLRDRHHSRTTVVTKSMSSSDREIRESSIFVLLRWNGKGT